MSGDHRKPVRLATFAYQAALAGKWESATRAIKRISDECGGAGVLTALVAWCDTYVDHATDGAMDVANARMNFIRADTGQLDDEASDQIPDRIRWAGQLVAARAAMDEERFMELVREPTDQATYGGYVGAVLETVATTVNGLPRGFARMGRGGAPDA